MWLQKRTIHLRSIDQDCERADLAELLSSRHRKLCETFLDVPWAVRRFPVLAVLAPVMTSTEGEITYPGDPMCLYAALSVAVDRAVQARKRGVDVSFPYPDLCPDWGELPSKEYRLRVGDDGIRQVPDGTHTTDQCVFDPRVWTEQTRHVFVELLRTIRPRVVMVSTVSPGHRYALQMAALVKREVPECLVVFGGRHIDETMRYDSRLAKLDFAYSSTVRVIEDGRAEPVVDFLVSGEGYFALDLLLRAIALAMDLDTKQASISDVVTMLDAMVCTEPPVPGKAVIIAVESDAVHAFPIYGPTFDLAELPSPYQAFAIRSRFPVFTDIEGTALRTAHLAVSNACPYHCNFCSESALLAGGLKRFRADPATVGVARVCEYISYGAEAVFFDDSVFWSGTFPIIVSFCRQLTEARNSVTSDELPRRVRQWIRQPDDWDRLTRLQWGAQFTADLLTTLHGEREVKRVLEAMRIAGCTYVYLGIESMSEQVMSGVHKNLRRSDDFPWKTKVRVALERINNAGIRVGSSILFGLQGETRETIDETIEEVGQLVDDGLLMLASPNILTYHPATPLTRADGMSDRLDYHSWIDNRPPYTYFEEAFPSVVSHRLTEDDIWHIHRTTEQRWGTQRNAMEPVAPQQLDGG